MSKRKIRMRRHRHDFQRLTFVVVDDVAPFGPPTEDEGKQFFNVLSRESRLISECCTVVDSSEDPQQ